MLVAKIMDYPWKKPDKYGGGNYETLVDDYGTKADKFWNKYDDCEITEDFKSFIESMLAFNPISRATMADILGHPWMRGKTITQQQFEETCKKFLDATIEEQKKANEELGVDHNSKHLTRRSPRDFNGIDFVNREFRPVPGHASSSKVKSFEVSGQPIDIMKHMYATAGEMGLAAQLSETKWKFSFPCVVQDKHNEEIETFKVQVELHDKGNVTFSRKTGSALTFKAFNDICK